MKDGEALGGTAPARSGAAAAVSAVERVPLAVWAMALGVALLRALPFLQLIATRPPRGYAYLPVGYIPKDWLQYVALIRQPADTGRLLLANPFTTEPQEGRFVLLFHQALGVLHLATGIDPFWLLELSRVPLLLVFFAVLWRFVGHLFVERRVKLWACALVALRRRARGALRCRSRTPRYQRRWPSGWSATSGTSTAGTASVLLQPAVDRRAHARARRAAAAAAAGRAGERARQGAGRRRFPALALVHSYSAMLVGAALAGVAMVELALDPPALRRRLPHAIAALAPPLVPLVALALWQLRDPVFGASAGNALGGTSRRPRFSGCRSPTARSAFFALRGFQLWACEAHPWRLAVGGWVAGWRCSPRRR